MNELVRVCGGLRPGAATFLCLPVHHTHDSTQAAVVFSHFSSSAGADEDGSKMKIAPPQGCVCV